MTQSITENTNMSAIDFIEKVQLSLAENKLKAKNLGEDNKDEEKKELRKKLKSHHKMLTEKADKHYEDGEKELGKKCRSMANKLAEDMEDENSELSLSNYEIDEASLSNPQLSEMQKIKADIEAKFIELQKSINENITAQLSVNSQSTTKLSGSEQIIAEMESALNRAKEFIKDGK